MPPTVPRNFAEDNGKRWKLVWNRTGKYSAFTLAGLAGEYVRQTDEVERQEGNDTIHERRSQWRSHGSKELWKAWTLTLGTIGHAWTSTHQKAAQSHRFNPVDVQTQFFHYVSMNMRRVYLLNSWCSRTVFRVRVGRIEVPIHLTQTFLWQCSLVWVGRIGAIEIIQLFICPKTFRCSSGNVEFSDLEVVWIWSNFAEVVAVASSHC